MNEAFAGLADLRATLPAGEAPVEAPSPQPEAKAPRRAVVRYQRKGRKGKAVTLVEQLELAPAQLDSWLRSLKSELGCGGVVEDGQLVLQGDQRKRLPGILEARGVRRISVS